LPIPLKRAVLQLVQLIQHLIVAARVRMMVLQTAVTMVLQTAVTMVLQTAVTMVLQTAVTMVLQMAVTTPAVRPAPQVLLALQVPQVLQILQVQRAPLEPKALVIA